MIVCRVSTYEQKLSEGPVSDACLIVRSCKMHGDLWATFMILTLIVVRHNLSCIVYDQDK